MDPLPGSIADLQQKKRRGAPADASALYDPGRALPQAADMERCVISCMMQAPDFAVPAVMGTLEPEDFSIEAHSILWDAVVKQFSQGSPVDPVTMLQWCYDHQLIGSKFDAGLVSEIYTASPNPTHVKHYAETVREKRQLRELITLCWDTATAALDCADAKERKETIEELQSGLAKLQKLEMHSHKGLRSGAEVVMAVAETMVQRHSNKGKILGLAVGYPDVDRVVNGFQRGDLITLAARPAMGKTSLGAAFADGVAVDGANKRNVDVLFVSLEMSDEQIMERSLLGRARMALSKGRTGLFSDAEGAVWRVAKEVIGKNRGMAQKALTDELVDAASKALESYWQYKGKSAALTNAKVRDSWREIEELSAAIAAVCSGRLTFYDGYGVTTQEVRAKIKEWIRRIGWDRESSELCPPLVVLDYAQLVRASEKKARGDKRLEVDETMKMLKGLAKEEGLAVIVLAQVGRSAEDNPRKKPALKDLKESGAIEEDSDYVMFIHRQSYYYPWDGLKDEEKKRWEGMAVARNNSKPGEKLGERWKDDETKTAGQKYYEADAQLIIAKGRHCPTCEIDILFYGDSVRFNTKTPALYANDKEMQQHGDLLGEEGDGDDF